MMISIGYRNYISADRIVAIVSPETRPTRNLIAGAKERGMLVDATMGKKTKSVIVTNSNHVVLSANSADTIVHRIEMSGNKIGAGEEN